VPLAPPSSPPASRVSSPPALAAQASLQLWIWVAASGWEARYCDLGHDNKEVGLLEAELFDFFVVGGGLAFEDDLLGVDGVPLLVTDLLLEVCDLGEGGSTVWLGSISTANTSPFRFFMLIFMIFQI
jgi:hypothetical protein